MKRLAVVIAAACAAIVSAAAVVGSWRPAARPPEGDTRAGCPGPGGELQVHRRTTAAARKRGRSVHPQRTPAGQLQSPGRPGARSVRDYAGEAVGRPGFGDPRPRERPNCRHRCRRRARADGHHGGRGWLGRVHRSARNAADHGCAQTHDVPLHVLRLTDPKSNDSGRRSGVRLPRVRFAAEPQRADRALLHWTKARVTRGPPALRGTHQRVRRGCGAADPRGGPTLLGGPTRGLPTRVL